MPEEQCKLTRALCSGPLAADEIAHGKRFGGVEVFEALLDGAEGMLGLILADLPLAFDPGDGEFEADDSLDLRCDVVGWCVSDLPWGGEAGLVLGDESVEVRAQPCRVFDDFERAIGMDDGVVPGGDDFAVFGFLGVPGG